jgi:hypothetical protein
MATAQNLDIADYLSNKEKTTLDALTQGANVLKAEGTTDDDLLNISISELFTNWANKMQEILTDFTGLISKLNKFSAYFNDIDNPRNWWVGGRKFLSEFITIFTKEQRSIYFGITLVIISIMIYIIQITS